MREFFNGWRRKTGCATLVVAVAFAVGWVRSLPFADYLGHPSSGTTYYIVSHGGLLELQMATPDRRVNAEPVGRDGGPVTTFATAIARFTMPDPVIWGTTRLEWYDKNIGLRMGGVDVDWAVFDIEWQWSVGSLSLISAHDGDRRAMKIVIPYWITTIPLTMLSAYLILWKPRRPSASGSDGAHA